MRVIDDLIKIIGLISVAIASLIVFVVGLMAVLAIGTIILATMSNSTWPAEIEQKVIVLSVTPELRDSLKETGDCITVLRLSSQFLAVDHAEAPNAVKDMQVCSAVLHNLLLEMAASSKGD